MSVKNEKKIKEAAAIQYTPGEDTAPRVIALGKGEAAERLLEKARESNVPIHTNPELAHTLSMLSLGDEIPPELYEIVAEILAFVNTLDKVYGERK